ncbi:hypothetical protein K7W42_06260 [Deinococcus sp. HMF7604]|uniref:WapI family immunity protein n=1 Tax=Deinococcus betulae TaxID=2873312 RepID=UPI001CCABCDE|nr:hypothetical protein [Deinococcus betulae]MBZ9750462.1 hypothetical protein [Deinococcus betulae]
MPDGRVWEVVDPCLTAREAHRLLAWLEEVSEKAPVFIGWQQAGLSSTESFTEPCLVLSARSAWFRDPDLDNQLHLRIVMQAEYLPPFARELDHSPDWMDTGEVSDAWVDFPVTQAELRALTAQWKAQVSRFPVRGEA